MPRFHFYLDSSYTNSTTESPTIALDATKTMKMPSPRYITLSTRFSACQTSRNARGTYGCHHQHNPLKLSVRTRFWQLWGFPGHYHHDNPSATCRHYNQLSTTPPQLLKSSADAHCGLSLPAATTTNHQPPHNRQNQASAPVPGASRLSLPVECTPNIHHTVKSSTARFCCSMGHT